MAKIPTRVLEKFNDPDAIKFLATVDTEGNPNVVCVSSLMPLDEETLTYANMMGVKTPRNLENTKKVAINIFIPKKNISYQIKGELIEFQKGGPILEKYASLPALKYDPYFEIKSIGLIKVKEVYSSGTFFSGRRIVPPEVYSEESSEKNKWAD